MQDRDWDIEGVRERERERERERRERGEKERKKEKERERETEREEEYKHTSFFVLFTLLTIKLAIRLSSKKKKRKKERKKRQLFDKSLPPTLWFCFGQHTTGQVLEPAPSFPVSEETNQVTDFWKRGEKNYNASNFVPRQVLREGGWIPARASVTTLEALVACGWSCCLQRRPFVACANGKYPWRLGCDCTSNRAPCTNNKKNCHVKWSVSDAWTSKQCLWEEYLDKFKCLEAKCREKTLEKSELEPTAPNSLQ